METNRILVTGGSGFIGTNLVNELRSRGHEVLIVKIMYVQMLEIIDKLNVHLKMKVHLIMYII